jgi:NADH:ubiquinone oxidoreductase subunit C
MQTSGAPPPAKTPSPAAPTAPTLPVDPRTSDLSAKLIQRFPSSKLDYVHPKRFKVTIPSNEIAGASLFIRDELKFDHLLTVSGTDYIAKKEIEVIYFVASMKTGQMDIVAALAERTPRDAPIVPTLVPTWAAAEYHERETFEMLGVKFDGHPDLRKILLPEDWDDIPPLRKDYTSPGR